MLSISKNRTYKEVVGLYLERFGGAKKAHDVVTDGFIDKSCHAEVQIFECGTERLLACLQIITDCNMKTRVLSVHIA